MSIPIPEKIINVNPKVIIMANILLIFRREMKLTTGCSTIAIITEKIKGTNISWVKYKIHVSKHKPKSIMVAFT